MFDLGDISNWRRIVRDFRETPDYYASHGGTKYDSQPLTPQPRWATIPLNITHMIVLVRTVLQNRELFDAYKQVGKWYADNPFDEESAQLCGNGRPNRTPWPVSAKRDAEDFIYFFYMKAFEKTDPNNKMRIVECIGNFLIENELEYGGEPNVSMLVSNMRRHPKTFALDDVTTSQEFSPFRRSPE